MYGVFLIDAVNGFSVPRRNVSVRSVGIGCPVWRVIRLQRKSELHEQSVDVVRFDFGTVVVRDDVARTQARFCRGAIGDDAPDALR